MRAARVWLRIVATRRFRALLLAAVAALLGFAAYHLTYTAFPTYDDTGDWSIGVWSFMHHGGLYSSTYGITGPFYYEFWTVVYAITGLGINPDTAALMSLICWIAATVLTGVAVRTLTRSLVLALLATLTCFILLQADAPEALEPAHISYVFTGVLLVGICAWPRMSDSGRTRAAIAGGVLCAATFLTKANIGALLSCAVLFAVAVHWPGRRVRMVLRPLACIGLLLVPPALMWTGLHGGLYHYYGGLFRLMEISLLGVSVVAFTTDLRSEPITRRQAYAGLVAAAVTVVIVWGIAVADGTPAVRLITKGIFGETNLVKWSGVLPPFPSGAITLAEYSTAAAIIVAALTGRWRSAWVNRWVSALFGRGRAAAATGVGSVWVDRVLSSPPLAALRVAAGLWIVVTCIPYWHFNVTIPIWFASFAVAVPLSWVAMLGRGAEEEPGLSFVRTLIAAIGSLGCLEVYPVAGSQEGWASVLLAPLALLCVWDGIEMLRASHWIGRRLFVAVASLGVLWSGYFLVARQGWPAMRDAYQAYHAWTSPAVPGGDQFRLPPPFSTAIHRTVVTLDRVCPAFYTSPGMYSFYFFTQKQPPTGLNVNQWRVQLSAVQQRTVVRTLKRIPRLCVVDNPSLSQFWYHGPGPVPRSVLFDYTHTGFVRVASYTPYTINVRRSMLKADAPARGRPRGRNPQ